MVDTPKKTWVVASDVSGGRDGIGIELFLDGDQVLEIFRDDTKKIRAVTLYKQDISLDLLEESIASFKERIPWGFLD